jgi:tRNA (guanine-N7-)-methyltransferase
MARADYPYANPPRLPEGDTVDLPAWLDGAEAGEIELEVGPGRGAFILERCAALPELHMLGIEIRRKWSQLVDERLAKLGYAPRGRVVNGDARLELARVVPDGCLARTFVHFPDPWWKKRHQKRVVVGDPLLEQLARLLRDDGELYIQTDVADRAAAFEAVVAAHPVFVSAGDSDGSPRMAENPYEGRSNRERRCEQDGLPVHRLRWRRRPRAA